jgi:GNAT superfamily N-acetyltransferase
VTIRPPHNNELPLIINLLKASLGDVSSEKSEKYWNWKHVNNPFGASPVLIAEENGEFIGVRAFMRWDWQMGDQVYRCLRAVDTATHPDHQGKGIFKKLTLQLIDEAGKQGYDFIFNTPNTQSTPGYLKMGWKSWGKVPLWIHPVLTFKKPDMQVWERCKQDLQRVDISSMSIGAWHIPLRGGIQGGDSGGGTSLFTPVTHAWLAWRYRDCPVKDYGLFQYAHKGNEVNLFFCLKGSGLKTELRICTAFFSRNFSLSLLTRASNILARKIGCRIVTCGGLGGSISANQIINGWFPVTKWSVMATVRNIPNGHYLPNENTNWLMQTGDMELF